MHEVGPFDAGVNRDHGSVRRRLERRNGLFESIAVAHRQADAGLGHQALEYVACVEAAFRPPPNR
jgi:hypothetical protein